MSIRPQAPAPFLSEEVAERLLALPTPPPSPLSPYSSPLPQIPHFRQYLYIITHLIALHMLRDLWDPELLGLDREMHYHLLFMRLRCLRFVYRFVRGRRTTPGPGYEVGESSDSCAAEQDHPRRFAQTTQEWGQSRGGLLSWLTTAVPGG
ncbi:hypothetical protein Tco_0749101 [Tanacetum coccineum]|uniref:Uncharacterized protein n=1 Tax=Tanacetum coccineum TaxID=301880 RepID=A0ABQ4YXR3_9ASTR